MRFVTPPTWPPMPEGWLPDPGWRPEPEWPAAPKGWRFWENDYGVAVPGPSGLYGARRRVLTGHGVVLAVVTGLLGFSVGAGGGADAGARAPSPPPTVVSSPAATPTTAPSK